ncbi:MAG: hypothetical protein V2A66_01210 [Pseudomonadota bacterium]
MEGGRGDTKEGGGYTASGGVALTGNPAKLTGRDDPPIFRQFLCDKKNEHGIYYHARFMTDYVVRALRPLARTAADPPKQTTGYFFLLLLVTSRISAFSDQLRAPPYAHKFTPISRDVKAFKFFF